MRSRVVVALVFAASLSARVGRAEPHELKRTEPLTLGIELGLSAVAMSAGILAPNPKQCRWCSPPGLDEAVAGWFEIEGRRPAAQLSHVLSFSVLPAASVAALVAPALSQSAPTRVALEDVSIALQAMGWNLALSQAVKKLVARRRPAFFYERSRLTEYPDSLKQRNQSFFSGDTSSAFVMASSVTTLAFLRGYSWAPYAAAAGGTLATATGLLRIAADVHWASDVFVGAVAGSAIGCLVPILLHPRAARNKEVSSDGALLLPEFGQSMTGLSWAGQF
ncbi:MAG TPA: phosphatase PAP2 family protein [Polyangiaceae bacterium]|nr:phosphatase PAP2 family protein [Polyangiaceae bacterium]